MQLRTNTDIKPKRQTKQIPSYGLSATAWSVGNSMHSSHANTCISQIREYVNNVIVETLKVISIAAIVRVGRQKSNLLNVLS